MRDSPDADVRFLCDFDQPCIAARGEYDVEVRYFDATGGGTFTLLMSETEASKSWQADRVGDD